MSIADFKKHIKAEDFVEWEEVYRDNFYGTLKSEVERIWAKGKNVILLIKTLKAYCHRAADNIHLPLRLLPKT